MGTDDFDVLALRFLDGAADHTVVHGAGNNTTRSGDPIFDLKSLGTCVKTFGLIIVFFADTL